MINIEEHFSLNRTLLLVVGLWPYQKSKLARLYLVCCFSIIISHTIFQLTTFVTSKCTTDHVIKILSIVFASITLIVKYASFCINAKTVTYLFEQLQSICDGLKDKNEIAIIEKFGSNANRYTSALTIFVVSGAFIIIVSETWPDLLHIILSINVSQPRRLKIMTEYFVDQEKYFYLLLMHQNVTVFLGLVALVATGTMLITYFQYACGMFQIASYRIEYAINIYILKDIRLPYENKVYEGLICAVDMHRKAMMFSKHLITEFEISFMFMIIFGVLVLSLSIFRIISLDFNIEELSLPLVTAFLSFQYMFLANLVGQEITDYCNHVYATAYNVRWYIVPLHIQKMLMFLIQRGNKTFGLNVGGLFVASLECFATLVNASVSYFAVIYSTR